MAARLRKLDLDFVVRFLKIATGAASSDCIAAAELICRIEIVNSRLMNRNGLFPSVIWLFKCSRFAGVQVEDGDEAELNVDFSGSADKSDFWCLTNRQAARQEEVGGRREAKKKWSSRTSPSTFTHGTLVGVSRKEGARIPPDILCAFILNLTKLQVNAS